MAEFLTVCDSIWKIMWYPLQSLAIENFIVSCPLLLLIVTMLFGIIIKLLGGLVR